MSEGDTRQRRTTESLPLGAVLAMAGGFLDTYTYVGRHGVFANAQTGNVVLFGVLAAAGHWSQALQHVPPILAFVLGVAVAETLRRPRVAAALRWPARAALVLEIAVLVVVGFLPEGVPDLVVTVTIAFVTSIQVSTFGTLIRWSYNTTVMTGNLRSAAHALYLAMVAHDLEARQRFRGFATIILCFLTGALLGAYLTDRLGPKAAWVASGILLAALALFVVDEWRERRPRNQPSAFI
jgi:uncharacterized membrane protein YoaK (UPF0700 family)